MTINDKRNKHMCNANGAKELWATQIHETFALQSQYILYFCRVIFFFFKFYPSKKHQTPKSGGWKEGGLGEAEIKHLPRKNNTPKKKWKWQENRQLQGRAVSDIGKVEVSECCQNGRNGSFGRVFRSMSRSNLTISFKIGELVNMGTTGCGKFCRRSDANSKTREPNMAVEELVTP